MEVHGIGAEVSVASGDSKSSCWHVAVSRKFVCEVKVLLLIVVTRNFTLHHDPSNAKGVQGVGPSLAALGMADTVPSTCVW